MEKKIKKILTWRQILSLPSEPKEHLCNSCGKVFSLKASLKRHMKTHAVIKVSRDDSQRKISEDIGTGVDIPSLPMEAKQYPCETCSKVFSRKSVLTRHMKIHAGSIQKDHQCEVCGRLFPGSSHLISHMSTHTGTKEYTCDICGKKLAYKASIKSHMDIHAGNKNFKCVVCGKGFVQKSTLTCHMNIHDAKRECEICGKDFVSKRYLQCHLVEVHFGVKSHKCGVCHKEFSRNTSLKAHEKLHARTKYRDDRVICLDGFFQKDNPEVRTGGKNFQCALCRKGFTLKSNLKHHMNDLHAPDKKHKCDVCEKVFSAKRYLKRHLSVHSGVKNHRCVICEKNFSRKSSVRRHLKLHAMINNHECDICGKKFIQKSSLMSHSCCEDRKLLELSYERHETTTPCKEECAPNSGCTS